VQDTVFLVFAIAAHYGVEVISGDVPAAYVQAKMPEGETVYYMYQPQGFEVKGKEGGMCKLLKCLYGLPQSGHQWNEEFAHFLTIELAMTRCECDPAAFIKWRDGKFFLLVVTVDDTIDCATSIELRNEIHEALVKKYTWKRIGVCSWHLGMRIKQDMDRITIDQTAYLKTILERFEYLGIKNRDTPMSDVIKPPNDDDEVTTFPYQSVVGSLIWLTKTRFDISYAVSQCARFMKNHTKIQDNATLEILGYLRKNPNWGVGFELNRSETTQPAYVHLSSDSSWADVLPTRESSFGYLSFFNGYCFQCRSKITPCV
jgi:hypothetical protein